MTSISSSVGRSSRLRGIAKGLGGLDLEDAVVGRVLFIDPTPGEYTKPLAAIVEDDVARPDVRLVGGAARVSARGRNEAILEQAVVRGDGFARLVGFPLAVGRS